MSLAGAREQGAKIHVVYSPADAEKYAGEHPDEQVTFLSVGFETTTPAGCLSVKAAREDGLDNYSILVANKTMPQAYEALKGSADVFLYPGHVNAITEHVSLRSSDRRRGQRCCGRIYGKRTDDSTGGYTGEISGGKTVLCKLLSASGDTGWKQQEMQQLLVDEMMEACDCEWRGLGVIPKSGMKLRQEWQEFDARLKYQMPKIEGKPNPACRCGDVLQGKCKPSDCKVFGKGCTPQHPIGACMVSGEGACSAYYQYS